MNTIRAALLLLMMSLFLILPTKGSQIMAQNKSTDSSIPPLDPVNMDTSVNPAENFYEYANGGWLRKNPIPAAYSRWGSFSELYDRNLDILLSVAEKSSAENNAAKGSDTQLVGDFYFSGMNTSAIDKDGIGPVEPYIREIDAIKNKAELQSTLEKLQRKGVSLLFYFTSQQDLKNSEMMIATVFQGGLSLPDRDYYTKTDKQSKEILSEYDTYMKKMFSLLGENKKTTSENADIVSRMETRLAKASMTRVEMRDPKATYNMMSIARLGALAPGFSWKSYLRYFDLSGVKSVNVAQPKFIREVGRMLKSVSLKDWKVYLKWHLVNSMAPYLSGKFVDEHFHFYGTVLTGAKELQPRWKRVLQRVDQQVGFALGRLYVAEHFSPKAKARAEEMVHNLETAFAQRIRSLDWMSEKTKKQALIKLKAIVNKIGYPDKWKSYEGLDIDRGPYVLNVMRANEFNFDYEINKVGKKVDRTEW